MKKNNTGNIKPNQSSSSSNSCADQFIANGMVDCQFLDNVSATGSNQTAGQISSGSEARNSQSSSTSGYQSTSHCVSTSSNSDLEAGAHSHETECPISEILSAHQLNLNSQNLVLTLPIVREDIARIETANGIQLVRYIKYNQNLDTYFVDVNLDETCTPEERKTILAIFKEYYSENWKKLFINTITHLGATGILTYFGLWDKLGLMPRMFNVVASPLSGFIDHCLNDKEMEKRFSKSTLNAFKVLKKLFNLMIIGGTVTETGIFNFGQLSADKQKEFANNFFIIFTDEVFFNNISKYFTVEQIFGLLHNIFSAINIFTKYDNKLTGVYAKASDLTRALLVIVGFGTLVVNILNGNIDVDGTLAKCFVTVGVQSACVGAYIWCGYILKDIFTSVKDVVNKYFTSETHL